MFKWLKERVDGKKLWTAISAGIAYGLATWQAKRPDLPIDSVVVPLLVALGIIGGGDKIRKAKAAKIGQPEELKD